MKVAVIKYNAGNIYSVVHGLNRLGIEPNVTDSIEEIQYSDCVIFPGQGEASKTMNYLTYALACNSCVHIVKKEIPHVWTFLTYP